MPANRSSFLLSFVHNAICGFNELFIRVCCYQGVLLSGCVVIRVCWEDRQTQDVEAC